MTTTNSPALITLKMLSVNGAPNIKDVQAVLAPYGIVMQYEANNLVFNGNALVPAPVHIPEAPQAAAAPTVQTASPAKKGGRKPGSPTPKVTTTPKAKAAPVEEDTAPKAITFEAGSDPERIWHLIKQGPALTSTQIREKLALGSNIVNTTIYRLKKAGMIRPMSHNAPNGDTLYTSTEWDPKPVVDTKNVIPLVSASSSLPTPQGDVRELLEALGESRGDEALDYGDDEDSAEDAF